MIDPLAAYCRLDNWLVPLLKRDPVLRRLPVIKYGAHSVHLQTEPGQVLALFGSRAPETATQKLLRRLWVLNPLATDFAGGTTDQYIYGLNSDYATARSTAASSQGSAAHVSIGQQKVSTNYYVFRGFVLFDTHTIGASSVVTQANLKMTVVADASTVDFDVQIVKHDWSSGTADQIYDGCLAGDADDSIWCNTNGVSLNTQYTSGNLSTAWVSKTGTTYYSLRSSRDVAASAPAGTESISVGAQNNTTAGYRPVLAVTYVVAAGRSFAVMVG